MTATLITSIAAICVGIYLIIGILMAILLWHTPYRDNGVLVITLLWPFFLLGMLGFARNRHKYPLD